MSPNGLVLTNYHCAVTCIQQISSAEKDYTVTGFNAASVAEEAKCSSQEANVLVEISDVTVRLKAKTAGLADKAAFDAHKAEIAQIEKECATSDNVRCEVITLYGGGVYNLYKYRRYQDVRLVFAPEFATAFFGGDPDNFMFPRYNLDMSFLRIYENEQPVKTPDHFPISAAGPKEGELTFVSGYPGRTNRQHRLRSVDLSAVRPAAEALRTLPWGYARRHVRLLRRAADRPRRGAQALRADERCAAVPLRQGRALHVLARSQPRPASPAELRTPARGSYRRVEAPAPERRFRNSSRRPSA